MSVADKKYKELIRKVLDDGVWDTGGDVRPVYEDGSPAHTKSCFGAQVVFEPGEIPAITIKRSPLNSSIGEVVHLFFQSKSTKLEDAESLGIKYWGEWADENNTIGRSYGYQLFNQKEAITIKENATIDVHSLQPISSEKVDVLAGDVIMLNQVDAMLYRIRFDPYSRRIMFAYWKPEDVNKKSLQECAWSGQVNIRGGYLDFLLTQRSVDLLHGIPSNWAGYYGLQESLAQAYGLKVGRFIHQMGNYHLYDNQIELAKQLLEAEEFPQPELYVKPGVESFYDYEPGDIKYVNYQCGDSVRTNVAI